MLEKSPSNVSDISDDHTSGMTYKIYTCEFNVGTYMYIIKIKLFLFN